MGILLILRGGGGGEGGGYVNIPQPTIDSKRALKNAIEKV